MSHICVLGGAAAFLGGAAVALLASYPIQDNSGYVGFIALFLAVVASLLAAWAIALYTTHNERVHAERIIDLTVDQILRKRGLEVVDDRD